MSRMTIAEYKQLPVLARKAGDDDSNESFRAAGCADFLQAARRADIRVAIIKETNINKRNVRKRK